MKVEIKLKKYIYLVNTHYACSIGSCVCEFAYIDTTHAYCVYVMMLQHGNNSPGLDCESRRRDTLNCFTLYCFCNESKLQTNVLWGGVTLEFLASTVYTSFKRTTFGPNSVVLTSGGCYNRSFGYRCNLTMFSRSSL